MEDGGSFGHEASKARIGRSSINGSARPKANNGIGFCLDPVRHLRGSIRRFRHLSATASCGLDASNRSTAGPQRSEVRHPTA
jgi:hypothetical protein